MAKRIITVAVSLLLAFALWAYVIIVIGPEYQDTIRGIKVEFVGEEELKNKDLMLISDQDITVDLVLSGNRVDLNKVNASNIYVKVDLSEISAADTQTYRCKVEVPNTVTLQSQRPVLTLEVVRRLEKEIDVSVTYDEDMIAEGYAALAPQTQESITILGPEDVVNQIAEAQITLELNEKNNKSDVTGAYVPVLVDEDGEKVDSRYITVIAEKKEIDVTLPIRMKKILPLKIHAIAGGGLKPEDVTITPATITVLGTEEDLKNLNEWYLNDPGEPLDLSLLTEEAPQMVYALELPKTLINKSGYDEATAAVSFEGIASRTFTFLRSEIVQMNLPTGCLAEISQYQLKITVRGSADVLERLEKEDITVGVDFSGAKVGQQKDWEVLIRIDSQSDAVGVVGGPYTVYVEMKDAVKTVAEQLLQRI